MTDLDMEVQIQITNLKQLKEVRRELERIKELKEEINDEEDKFNLPDSDGIDINPDPIDDRPFEPEFPNTPKWVVEDEEDFPKNVSVQL